MGESSLLSRRLVRHNWIRKKLDYDLMPSFIGDNTLLRAPAFSVMRVAGQAVAIDPAKPHWVATDDRGIQLLGQFDGRTPFGRIVKDYASQSGLDLGRAWLHVETLARDALRHGFLSADGAAAAPYLGRESYLNVGELNELWVQVNDFCNLECQHCLVSSGPGRSQGLGTEQLCDAIDQAVSLGAERIFFTGGEPLARPDILDICKHVVKNHGRELVILTNGTLLRGDTLSMLAELSATTLPVRASGPLSPSVRVQVSLDGSNAEVNDPIRGIGSFAAIVSGVKAAVAVGLRLTLTATILKHNIDDLQSLVHFASEMRVRNIHLLWPHKRGRIVAGEFSDLPAAEDILKAVRGAREVARELDVVIDNIEEFRHRLDGNPGVKNDLAGAGWNSLCLSTDGWVYPSPSTAGVPELQCGDLSVEPLAQILKNSVVCRELRSASVDKKPLCRSCVLKFLCGGGDLEHGYWTSAVEGAGQRGSFLAHDPYCDLYKGLAGDALAEMSREGRATVQEGSGFDRPVVFRAMGENTFHDEDSIVRTTHSACVLSEEVLERSRSTVREFYGNAAVEPKSELCCPVQPAAEDLAHIPKEVVDRFYGCGSPITAAALEAGETVVDLGSGAGIDCFIAAKKVGASGRVYGVDMTEQMLSVARECQPKVARALGYDAIEFRHGFLEQIPLDKAVADVVTSNCVINLSPDKPRVLREIWRVLRDHGRAVIADIVSDRSVPPKMRADGQLWGECISGALTEEEFLSALERAGFYGVSILKKTLWREVEGCQFSSVTVRGYKFEKKSTCEYVGQYAIYLGPQKAVIDEEGHLFPRGTPVEVCSDTASKLSSRPYVGSFVIVDDPNDAQEIVVGGGDGDSCGPTCC